MRNLILTSLFVFMSSGAAQAFTGYYGDIGECYIDAELPDGVTGRWFISKVTDIDKFELIYRYDKDEAGLKKAIVMMADLKRAGICPDTKPGR